MIQKAAADGLHLFARAKINLYLHVTGRRADGYHRLDSLVAFADVGDNLTIGPAPLLALEVSGPMGAGLTADDDNLVLRAARCLALRAGVSSGARIRLDKNLPVGAGIGGGSSDAAAALLGLGRLWNVHLSTEDWDALGLSLGADVPVCLRGTSCHLSGVGEILTKGPALPPVPTVLVNPRVPLPTAEVFRLFEGPFSPPDQEPPPESFVDAESLAAFLRTRGNDLTAAALRRMPLVGDILDGLRVQRGCLLSRMSGSGATCFGLFATPHQAESAANTLRKWYPDFWIVITTFV